MPHGEYKTTGGKLVIADFQVADGRLTNVSISGDFFLEPPEALHAIDQSLEGMSTSSSEQDLAAAIKEALSDDVAMVGFSPEAIAVAIRRGIEA